MVNVGKRAAVNEAAPLSAARGDSVRPVDMKRETDGDGYFYALRAAGGSAACVETTCLQFMEK